MRKTFPFGSPDLDHFELNVRLEQLYLLKEAGFRYVEERDIPLSSEEYPIDDYIILVKNALNL